MPRRRTSAHLKRSSLAEPRPKPAAFQTDHVSRFRCIGSACEDTCCHGWNVLIDLATYEKYQSLSDTPIAPLFNEHLVLNESRTSDFDHARVKLLPSGSCAFLSSEHLCSIQVHHGAESLSATCANYPRVSNRIGNSSETTLLLSCPEAARIVLLDPHLFQPEPGSSYRSFSQFLVTLPASTSTPEGDLLLVRHFCLLLFKDRSYPLWQRMFVFGMFCLRLKSHYGADPRLSIPALLKSYADLLDSGSLRPAMERIPSQPFEQLSIILRLIDRPPQWYASHQRFYECTRDFLSGIHYTPASTVQDCLPHYVEARSRHYEPWLQKHPHILENYLLDFIFKNHVPFGSEINPSSTPANPQVEYLRMVLYFTLIDGLLTGMAAHHREAFSPAHAVQLIQSFTKSFEHDGKAREDIARFILTGNLCNTAAIAALLRP